MSQEEDERWMREALAEAQIAYAAGEVPVGAVLVYQGKIVARAHNEVESRKDGTAHAEFLAVRRGEEALQMWRLEETTLYVTKEPCAMCAGALVNCRVPRLVFGCSDPRCGAAGGCLDVCNIHGALQKIQIQGKILEEECRLLLQNFFRQRRAQSKQTEEKE